MSYLYRRKLVVDHYDRNFYYKPLYQFKTTKEFRKEIKPFIKRSSRNYKPSYFFYQRKN